MDPYAQIIPPGAWPFTAPHPLQLICRLPVGLGDVQKRGTTSLSAGDFREIFSLINPIAEAFRLFDKMIGKSRVSAGKLIQCNLDVKRYFGISKLLDLFECPSQVLDSSFGISNRLHDCTQPAICRTTWEA
jgi:hypothetical protein